MALSEKELLLLDNFMYADISVNKCSIADLLDQYSDESGKVTAETLKGVTLSGGISAKEMADIMNDMKKSPDIMRLKVVDSCDSGIRGSCFVDSSTNEATVTFRGTGGTYSQWYDNLEGSGDVETIAQKKAKEFIKNLSYDDILVSGHSKGGNLAMYVTVTCGDKIRRCVSYDGQGFSKEFLYAYRQEIANNSSKITSISGYNDPVNILLNNIASEVVYVNTSGGIFNHGSYDLYKSNKYDKKGDFSKETERKQAIHLYAIESGVDIYTWVGNPIELEVLTDVLGGLIGLGFQIKTFYDNPELFIEWLKEVDDLFRENITKLKETFNDMYRIIKNVISLNFNYGYNYSKENPIIKINTSALKEYGNRLESVNSRLRNLDSRMNRLYTQVGYQGLWDLICADTLTCYSLRIRSNIKYLKETAKDFEVAEKKIQEAI